MTGDHFRRHCRHHLVAYRGYRIGARLLGTDRIGLAQFSLGDACDLGDQCFIFGWSGPVPCICTYRIGHFIDRVDDHLHLFVAEHHRAQHDLFGQLLRFGFDHLHRVMRTGHHQIQL